MDSVQVPLVSCIMPTYNRRAFVPHAIRYFLRQDYPNKELVILDDGSDTIGDLVPQSENIRYLRVPAGMTLGEKRNRCIGESKGELILHWDDDDWMAPHRISYQVRELLARNAEVCGLTKMFFCELETGRCWLYRYPENAKPWLAGGSLLYTKNFWAKSPFPHIQVASDTEFIFARKLERYVALEDHGFYVASIHGHNTSHRKTNNHYWQPCPSETVKNIMGMNDWVFFALKTQNSALSIVAREPGSPKTKVAILITTYERAEFLNNLVQALQRESPNFDLTFFIFDDAVAANGKKNYWKTINALWEQARGASFQYYIQMPDDMSLCEDFVAKAIHSWENIGDPKKICLNLLLDGHRLGRTCWTDFWPQLYLHKGGRYLRIQWVDMFFICERSFFEQLNWEINPIPPNRWESNPRLSSGVGQQISQRLHKKGWRLFQTTLHMAEHLGDESKMNPQVRAKEPLISAQLPLIYAGMASIPRREPFLRVAIESIIPYLDGLYLYLNDYKSVPAWLNQYPKVIPFLSRDLKSDMGDAGKFYGLNRIESSDYYYFTLDDDMIYPAEYVWRMIEKIEKHQRKGIVGCGGYTMRSQVRHFYSDRNTNWHISSANGHDQPVHILHTCLTAWHASTLAFKYEDCEAPNMGDIWLALAAQKQNVPMILIERPAGWVKVAQIPIQETIFGQASRHCPIQTDVYNRWNNWRLIPL